MIVHDHIQEIGKGKVTKKPQASLLNNKICLTREQAEKLKSHERRPEVNRLDGQWARWSLNG